MITASLKPLASETPDDQFKYLLDKRKNELDHMIEKADDVSLHTKENLIVESRFLQLKDLYKSVFQKVSEGLRRENRSLYLLQTSLLDRSYMRRERLARG